MRQLSRALAGIAMAIAAFAASAPLAGADVQIAPQGSGAGQVLDPRGLAVDPTDGTLFVADRGNRRVDVFDPSGEFVRAFGWGVVASGPGDDPQNEVQRVEVDATGGNFTLRFYGNTENGVPLIGGIGPLDTVSIPFDADAAAVASALEGLAAFFFPGDVSVAGPAGGPWTIEFTGAWADTDVLELVEGPGSELTGGAASIDVETLREGANYEVCEPSEGDVCRAGQRGTRAGQLNPLAVAVDPATHDVYVFDGLETGSTSEAANNRVQKFTAEGDFLFMLGGGVNLDSGSDLCTAASGDTCGRGAKGSGAGEFNAEWSSLGVGPGGVLHVNDGAGVQKFESSGALIGQVGLPGVASRQLAVDSTGAIYAVGQAAVRKYDPSGTQLNAIALNLAQGIAVDAADQLYVASEESGRPGISRFDAAGNLELVLYGERTGSLPAAAALAPYPPAAGGDIYTIEGTLPADGVGLLAFPPPGPVVHPAADATFAGPIGNVRATLNSEVNPEGKATTYHFEYVEQATFEADGGWSSAAVRESAESASIGADFLLHKAQAQIGCANPATEASACLTPSTLYRFRAVASNPDGSDRPGPDATFTTKDPIEFGPLWSTAVGTDSAILHAEANPVALATTAYFELVGEEEFKASGFANATRVPAGAPLDFGAGEAFLERSAQATGLAPGSAYRYRLVASNNCKPAEPTVLCSFESEPQAFRTFAPAEPVGGGCANAALRPGPAAFLADCRAYEMVSPLDKDGGNVEGPITPLNEFRGFFNQSAADGQSVTYSAYKAFADPESSPFMSQYLARRSASGWVNESISPPQEGPMLNEFDSLNFQFKAFTADLCLGWVRQDTAKPLLAPGAIVGQENIYRRDNCAPGEGDYEAASRDPEGLLNATPRKFSPQLEGISADGATAVFSAEGKLTENARNGKRQAYEASGGQLRLVCLMPERNAKGEEVNSPEGCSLGGSSPSTGTERERNLVKAVSEDGSHVFWSTPESKKLYVRIDGSETVAISETVNSSPAFFWGAAADGSKAIFTIGTNLYEFDVAARTTTLLAGQVQGVAGMSEDASRIYFVSKEALAAGAVEGKPNLYLREGGSERFVAVVPDASLLISPIAPEPHLRSSRTTPDGEQIVFMSSGSLTGYDNTDAASGEADQEVFLYDSTAEGGAGRLACVSCNPSGARPVGRAIRLHGFNALPVAARIPTWTSQIHAPRVISEDGRRVFFNSYDALVARDTNGAQDVYQWEAAGKGDCTQASPSYVPAAAGCVGLISTGQSPEDSEYVDSSASGEDVFFLTYSSLAPSDPGLLDVYDARIGGGFQPPPPPPRECEGEACQRPGPAPEAPTPASSVAGPGNVVPGKAARRCPKGKRRARQKGRIVCVKRKRAAKGKRAAKRKRAAKGKRAATPKVRRVGR